jgi:hypothetical protein
MKIKEEQRQLEEEIDFEIEKKRRLEMDGTITKLRTQVDEFAKNFEGKIMPNNLELFYFSIDVHQSIECDELRAFHGIISEDEYKKRSEILRKKQEQIREEKKPYMRRVGNRRLKTDEKFITLDKFTNNLKHISDETKAQYKMQHNGKSKEDLVTVPPEIKIYNDITLILTTILGVMKKQQDEIKNLQEQLDKC